MRFFEKNQTLIPFEIFLVAFCGRIAIFDGKKFHGQDR